MTRHTGNRPVAQAVNRPARAHHQHPSAGDRAPSARGLRHWILMLLLVVPLQGLAAGPSHHPAAAGARLPIKASQRALVQSLAAQALLKVSRARRQLQQHHDAAAIQELRETQALFDLMQAVHPAGRVKALIRYLRTVLNTGDDSQSLPDLLPVYTALGAMPDSPAVRAARKHLDAARHALEQPDVQTAEQQLKAASKALTIDGIDFPLDAAREDLSVVLHSLLHHHTVGKTRLQSMEQDLLLIAGGPGSHSRS